MALDPPTMLAISTALAAAAALYLAIEWRSIRESSPPASLAALIEQGDAARSGRDSMRLVDRTLARQEPLQAG